MPVYTIQHATPLTRPQKDEVAARITKLHADLFNLPQLYFEVVFQDTSAEGRYIGGRLRNDTNHLTLSVRAGLTNRTQDDWRNLIEKIEQIWDEVVVSKLVDVKGQEGRLQSFEIDSAIVAAMENGIFMATSAPGEDQKWFKDNWGTFMARADGGDEDFKKMIEEAKAKGIAPK